MYERDSGGASWSMSHMSHTVLDGWPLVGRVSSIRRQKGKPAMIVTVAVRRTVPPENLPRVSEKKCVCRGSCSGRLPLQVRVYCDR